MPSPAEDALPMPVPDSRPAPEVWADPAVAAWIDRATGTVTVGDHRAVVWDLPARDHEAHVPLVIIHGFPTSSFDFAGVVDDLSRDRRVLLCDLVGYGASDKPDQRYTMAGGADVVAAMVAAAGIDRLALLTHDMGDTVGGELLARAAQGDWAVDVTRRVITNGSIYIEMANLTDGQRLLLDQGDEKAPAGPGAELLAISLANTLAPASRDRVSMQGHAELVAHGDGDALLPRLVRYIEERRSNQTRFTGAIEAHPSPLHVVWGALDPIAVVDMAHRLADTRRAASLPVTVDILGDLGHYPMVEDPVRFAAAVRAGLDA
mgnify:CR=1 FL=1